MYLLVCTATGKGYVGYTADLQQRVLQHANPAAAPNPHLQAAVQEHAPFRAHWQVHALQHGLRNEHAAKTCEVDMIRQHATLHPAGYKSTWSQQL